MVLRRHRTRRSIDKTAPSPADLDGSELAYTPLNGRLWIKNEINGAIELIGGKEYTDRVDQLVELVGGVNQLPVVQPSSRTVLDTVPSVTGNLLTNASDPEGTPIAVTSVLYAGVVRTPGVTFSTTYGSMRINTDGNYTFTPNGLARALLLGTNVSEVFQYGVSDQAGGSRATTFTLIIEGRDSAPVASNDTAFGSANAAVQTGNVLSNDTDAEGDALAVVSFKVDGDNTVYTAGQTATIGAFGTFSMSSDGSWIRTKADSVSGTVVVRYTFSDGTNDSEGVLSLVLSGSLSASVSNPVTTALTGTRVFDVGPGRQYAEPNEVPWASLVAGDVVNIYHRPTPYVTKFGLAAQGEANAKVIINGVTDASGNRPILDGEGATVSPGSMPGTADNIWAAGDEGFGLITVKRRPSRPTSENPRWITIQNLEIKGARADATYTNSLNQVVAYAFSAGIWFQPSTDITIRNCVIHDNSQGIFTMSKPGGMGESCQRVRVLYNRIYGNGAVGSGYEHGCYIQGYDVLIEGNYLGRNRNGAGGSAYKSRVGKEIIRYNWIESSSRMIDMVHPEFIDAFTLYPDFGIDFVYGNVLVNDERLGDNPANLVGNAWRPIHFGADGIPDNHGGEWDGAGSAPHNHRKKLYFFNNTYFHNSNYNQADQFFLQLSWPETICEAWGNVIVFRGSIARLNLLYLAGTLNLRGTNLLIGYTTILDASTVRGATSASHAVNRLGTIITADPQFVSEQFYDFSLAAGSPCIDIFSALPAGIPPEIASEYPVEGEPMPRSNGVSLRPANTGAFDIGALERDPAAPPRVKPVMAQASTFDLSSIYSPGNPIAIVDPTWLYNPTTIVRQWQKNNDGVWEDIVGETNTVLNLTAQHVGELRVKYEATNVLGTTTEYSEVRTVTNAAAAAVIQITSGSDAWPTAAMVSKATFAQPPAIGNTLVAFLMAGAGIGDNFGNAWTLRQDADTGFGERRYQMYTTVVTATGAGFEVTGSSNGQDVSSLIVYEVAGTYTSSVIDLEGAGGTSGDVVITATTPNQRIIAGFTSGRAWGNEAMEVGAPWTTGARLLISQVDPPHTVVHGVSASAGDVTISATPLGHQYIAKIAVLISS